MALIYFHSSIVFAFELDKNISCTIYFCQARYVGDAEIFNFLLFRTPCRALPCSKRNMMLARPRAASPASCSFSSDLLAGREKEKTEKHCVGDAKMVGGLAGLCAARPALQNLSLLV